MIDAKGLLAALQGQQKKLEKDLREQVAALPELKQALEEEYKAARAAERTAETFGSWCDEQLTQAAVAWLLACVFLRFCEDNRLIPEPLLAGPGDGNRRARERAREYFNRHPTENERHYLEHCFDQLAQYPAVAGLYDRRHNPLFHFPLSYDAAKALVDFWQRVDPDTGELARDFTDSELNTRFLGDLYQDLSESARKRYALLQTPEFVEEFILERTLEPAIQTFGLETVRMIDPTCGSGHFLLGGFRRLLDHWAREAPGLDIRERVKRAMDAVYGVDINPFAVAIARFRLLVAALLDESSVPALRVLRYKESGLRKRADWEATWDLQRREDAIDAQVAAALTRREDETDEAWQERLKKAQAQRKKAELGDIPVPPKYQSGDFLNSTLWRLRGALDVPKERFFSLPGGDLAGGWLYGWAGWNPAERVQALFGAYTEGAERKGWETAQLLPFLAAIDEELPWVLQWHNEVHPDFGVRLGDFFRERLGQALQQHELTRDDLTHWKPTVARRRARG